MPLPTMTIREFKDRNPEFGDEPSDLLAKELHKRFYSDVPYQDYLSVVLPDPLEDQDVSLLGVSPGLDLTAATGASAVGSGIINDASDLLNELLGTDIPAFSEAAEELIPAISALSTIATTEMMKTISGKENLQLQIRLQQLQVPPKKFLYNDRRALNQFRTSSRTMDFAANLLSEKLESGELDRKQTIQTKRDLSAARALQREYDKLVSAYERKISGPEENTMDDLDQFFRF